MKIIESFKIHSLIKKINEALDPALEKRLRKDLKKYCEETGKGYNEICKLAGLDTKGYDALTSDIVDFIDTNADGEWTFDKATGRINIEGGFSLYSSRRMGALSIIKKIRFGKIEGNFRLSSIEMTDEIWEHACPEIVEGDINLYGNELTSVILPKVKNGINISENKIVSLEGCPEEVNGSFDCGQNNLNSLEGGPKIVGSNYVCDNQRNVYAEPGFTLKGCAETIGGSFTSRGNNLKTLEGGPRIVERGVDLKRNSLADLKGNWEKIGGGIDVEGNNLATLEGIPLGIPSKYIECKMNLIPPTVLKETYIEATKMKSWIAAYLKLATDTRFKRMGKKERDPIVAKITPELIAKNPIAMAPIWRDTELLNDPVIKRRIKQSGINKDEVFQKDVTMAADLAELGF